MGPDRAGHGRAGRAAGRVQGGAGPAGPVVVGRVQAWTGFGGNVRVERVR